MLAGMLRIAGPVGVPTVPYSPGRLPGVDEQVVHSPVHGFDMVFRMVGSDALRVAYQALMVVEADITTVVGVQEVAFDAMLLEVRHETGPQASADAMAAGFGRDQEQSQFGLGDAADLADTFETAFCAMPVGDFTQRNRPGLVGAQPVVDAGERLLRMRVKWVFTVDLGESQAEDLPVEFGDFRPGSAFKIMQDESFRHHLRERTAPRQRFEPPSLVVFVDDCRKVLRFKRPVGDLAVCCGGGCR